MIIPIKDLLDSVARRNGHANWQLCLYRLSPDEIHKLMCSVIQESTERGFTAGWSERAKRVSYPKEKLQEIKSKEMSYIKHKLLPQ